DNSAQYEGAWTDLWSAHFPGEAHPITPTTIDVDYDGDQRISAWYYMMDMPIWSFLNILGGARLEHTELSIINHPEADVKWYPNNTPTDLNPGDADVDFQQDDMLPSIGIEVRPIESVVLRGSYSETVARQTFKELTPIQQQEFLGGDVFIGNPNLEMSALQNYDLRADYAPYPGGLVSLSWFRKTIDRPIEYVQQLSDFVYTTAINYPEGELNGYEIEIRQSLGQFWEALEGLSLGGNMTLIDSSVALPESEQQQLASVGIATTSRDMLNAPEHLYNLNMTYAVEKTGTELGLFYAVKGDTLVVGGGTSNGKYVPDVYEKEYGSLNFSISQKLGEHVKLTFKAKNLTDPSIEEVYRGDGIGDVSKTSYTKGIDYSIDVSATW
ncbi:MAG: TonB-dependent receptor, partial [Kiritimatiellales bacterium]|nr:TonB-dependent receptor [Kiritimatiellales bacterium]